MSGLGCEEVITVGEKRHGRWVSATLTAVEDEHLH